MLSWKIFEILIPRIAENAQIYKISNCIPAVQDNFLREQLSF